MTKSKLFPIVVICLVFIFGFLIFNSSSKIPNQPLKTQPTASENPSPTTKDITVTYPCQKGKSVFELLQINTNDLGTIDTSFGKQVIRINSVKQGDNKYWLYKVDQKEATVGAEAYICQDKEEISWELR